MFNNLIEYKNQIAFFDNNKSVVYYKDIISLSNKLKKNFEKFCKFADNVKLYNFFINLLITNL